MKFKVGGRTPGRGRRAGPRSRARPPDPTSRSWSTPTRATSGPQAVEFGRRVADLDIRWFEEPCRWTNDRALDARRALPDGHARRGRPERGDARRPARPRRGRRPSTSATSTPPGRAGRPSGAGRRAVRGLRRRDGPSRGAAGRRRTCSRPCRATRSWSASTRSATRSSGSSPTCRRSSATVGCTCPSARASASSSTRTTWSVTRSTVASPPSDRRAVTLDGDAATDAARVRHRWPGFGSSPWSSTARGPSARLCSPTSAPRSSRSRIPASGGDVSRYIPPVSRAPTASSSRPSTAASAASLLDLKSDAGREVFERLVAAPTRCSATFAATSPSGCG